MYTKCTNPDAPLYSFDLVTLSFVENTLGLDMPCAAMMATGTTVLGLLVFIPIMALAIAAQGRV